MLEMKSIFNSQLYSWLIRVSGSSAEISTCLCESSAACSIPESSECHVISRNQHMPLWEQSRQLYSWIIRVSGPQQESAHVSVRATPSALFLSLWSVTSAAEISTWWERRRLFYSWINRVTFSAGISTCLCESGTACSIPKSSECHVLNSNQHIIYENSAPRSIPDTS